MTKKNIQRLEEVGFKWILARSFEDHFRTFSSTKESTGIAMYQALFDHITYSLGQWCKKMRQAYRKIQNGKTPSSKHFRSWFQVDHYSIIWWSLQRTYGIQSGIWELQCTLYSWDVSFFTVGRWCNKLSKKIQSGQQPVINLTTQNIKDLEEAGFEWNKKKTFDNHFKYLQCEDTWRVSC